MTPLMRMGPLGFSATGAGGGGAGPLSEPPKNITCAPPAIPATVGATDGGSRRRCSNFSRNHCGCGDLRADNGLPCYRPRDVRHGRRRSGGRRWRYEKSFIEVREVDLLRENDGTSRSATTIAA